MSWSFGLSCWLTGHSKLDILGPSPGGTAFLNPDAFCSPPASVAAGSLLQSCPCTLPRSLVVPGTSRTLPCTAGLTFCSTGWQSWCHPGGSWALGSTRPGAACGRAADGDPALALAAAGIPARPASGPPPAVRRWETCPCAAGPAEPVEPELAGSPPAAAPHPGQPVCPVARRGRAACLGSARAQRAGSCQLWGLLGLPRGSGKGYGSRRSRELAPAVGGGWGAWEPPAAPWEPRWGWLCQRGWIRWASLSPISGLRGIPWLLSGMGAGLHTLHTPLHTPSHPCGPLWAPRPLPRCCGVGGGNGVLGWFDQGWGPVCGISPSAWSRLADGGCLGTRHPSLRAIIHPSP